MDREAGVSASTAGLIWAGHGIKPHLSRTFKLSNDKRFEERLGNVVGLYLAPPEDAVGFRCDEKPGIRPWTAPTRSSSQERAQRDHDSRLQAQRHHLPLRCAGGGKRQSHRNLHEETSAHRMAEVSATDGEARAGRQGDSSQL